LKLEPITPIRKNKNTLFSFAIAKHAMAINPFPIAYSTLTTDSFINVLRHFVSRRGLASYKASGGNLSTIEESPSRPY